MNKNVESKERRAAAILTVFVVCMFPSVAMAEPWDGMANTILGILTNGLTRTFAIIACAGLGIAAWLGKLTWDLAIRFVIGIVLVFGGAIVVDKLIGGL